MLFPTSRVVRSNQPKYVKPFMDPQVKKEIENTHVEVFRKKDIKAPFLKKRQLASSNIEKWFEVESVFEMWRELHSEKKYDQILARKVVRIND